MRQGQKGSYEYMVSYSVKYAGTRAPATGEFIQPHAHPREDQVIRHIQKLVPDLAEAEYLSVQIRFNPANLGYKPEFGLDNRSLRRFIEQGPQS